CARQAEREGSSCVKSYHYLTPAAPRNILACPPARPTFLPANGGPVSPAPLLRYSALATVMNHAQWMKLTYGGLTSIRSAQLKQVDNTLAAYHKSQSPANLDALQKSLVGWMQKEGPKWKVSVRNKFGAVA